MNSSLKKAYELLHFPLFLCALASCQFTIGRDDPAIQAGIGPLPIAPLERDVLGVLSRERGVSRSALALAWLRRHPSGILPIVGSTNPDRIREATPAAELELTREEWYRLMEAAHGQRLP